MIKMESKFSKLFEESKFALLILAIIVAFFLIVFGITGAKVILGFILFFFLPTYLIFKNFDIEPEEKIAFSFFIGLGIFPTFVYYIGLLISSMRWSIAISFVLLLTIGIAFSKYYPKSKKDKESKEEKE